MKAILKKLQSCMTSEKNSVESKQQIAQSVTYDKEKLLGEGSFSRVYKGVMYLPNGAAQKVAVKTMPFAEDEKRENDKVQSYYEECCESLKKEMEVFKALRSMPPSPYLVQSYESKEVREKSSNVLTKYAIVMEYAPYDSLMDFVNNKGSLTPTECYKVVSGIANGIDFLHDHGFIHGDVKPYNILLNKKKEPKIADLGSVEREEKNCPDVCGTYRYAAPETVQGGKRITKAVDAYSFGMTLYHFIAAKPPFKDYGRSDEIESAIKDGRRPLIPATCPTKMKTLITDCWQQNPVSRPTMKKVIKRIEEIGGRKKELLACKVFQRVRK